jgi:tetratricopeptide (TPR) repeat protein
VLKDQGDLAGALRRYEEAERIDRAAYGDDYPQVATRVNNIGSVLKDQGDLAGAQERYRDAFTILLKAFGPRGEGVATMAVNLRHVDGDPLGIARSLAAELGRPTLAEDLRRAMLELYNQHGVTPPPDIANPS